MKEINSVSNELIANLKKLKLKKYRRERGLYLIEGRRLVTDALALKAPITMLLVLNTALDFFNQAINSARQSGIEIICVSKSVIAALSETISPEGIIAVAQAKTAPIQTGGPLIALDRIQDPGNLGTIIRTCDAAGLGGVLLNEGCAELYNPKVVRSAMGSIFNVPIKSCSDFKAELMLLKGEGYTIAAAALGGSAFYQTNLPRRTILLIGNEGSGISSKLLSIADITVTLPMHGGAQSLNASIAAGIMIYDICFNVRRQE